MPCMHTRHFCRCTWGLSALTILQNGMSVINHSAEWSIRHLGSNQQCVSRSVEWLKW